MRDIVQNGHPVLRLKAKKIALKDIGSSFLDGLIADMQSLLAREEYGVALAAPQVGESLRLFIVSGRALTKRKEANRARGEEDAPDETPLPVEDEIYINPDIVKTSRGKKDKHEGCLSVRGKWGLVPRAEKVTLHALNEKGEKITRGATGFLAHIFQHETDHLDGILYIDKASEVYEDQKPAAG